VKVEVALQWCSDAFSDTLLGFVNSIKTIDGGTHMDGFKAALTRTVNALGRKTKTLKEGDPNLSGDHIREGLGAVVSVKVSSFTGWNPPCLTCCSWCMCFTGSANCNFVSIMMGSVETASCTALVHSAVGFPDA